MTDISDSMCIYYMHIYLYICIEVLKSIDLYTSRTMSHLKVSQYIMIH